MKQIQVCFYLSSGQCVLLDVHVVLNSQPFIIQNRLQVLQQTSRSHVSNMIWGTTVLCCAVYSVWQGMHAYMYLHMGREKCVCIHMGNSVITVTVQIHGFVNIISESRLLRSAIVHSI